MGGYRLVIHRKARKALERLPIVALERLRETLTEIAEQPRRGDKHLKGEYHCLWRRRVGDLRIIYRVSDSAGVVAVVEICWRRSCY